MNLYYAIKILRPGIHGSEFILQDDGEGVYIKEWRHNSEKPTQEELNSVAEQSITHETLMVEGVNALKYLKNTDWYTSRLAENGTEIPADILDARENARQKASAAKDAGLITSLNL
jgi:hypothetical protein